MCQIQGCTEQFRSTIWPDANSLHLGLICPDCPICSIVTIVPSPHVFSESKWNLYKINVSYSGIYCLFTKSSWSIDINQSQWTSNAFLRPGMPVCLFYPFNTGRNSEWDRATRNYKSCGFIQRIEQSVYNSHNCQSVPFHVRILSGLSQYNIYKSLNEHC